MCCSRRPGLRSAGSIMSGGCSADHDYVFSSSSPSEFGQKLTDDGFRSRGRSLHSFLFGERSNRFRRRRMIEGEARRAFRNISRIPFSGLSDPFRHKFRPFYGDEVTLRLVCDRFGEQASFQSPGGPNIRKPLGDLVANCL